MYDERHGRHRDERERDVDREHLGEREHRDAALHEDARGEREVHLHRADVGVGAGDELARLDAVVERERHAAQVLVHDVPQVVLDAVRRLQQVVPRRVREDEPDGREHRDDGHEVLERRTRGLAQCVDGLADLVRDLHLHREAEERREQREAEHPLVRQHHRHDPPEPRPTPVGLDVGSGRRVAGRDADRHERRPDVGAERAHLDGHESRLHVLLAVAVEGEVPAVESGGERVGRLVEERRRSRRGAPRRRRRRRRAPACRRASGAA